MIHEPWNDPYFMWLVSCLVGSLVFALLTPWRGIGSDWFEVCFLGTLGLIWLGMAAFAVAIVVYTP